MKLHLPRKLFRAVLACMAAVSSACAAPYIENGHQYYDGLDVITDASQFGAGISAEPASTVNIGYSESDGTLHDAAYTLDGLGGAVTYETPNALFIGGPGWPHTLSEGYQPSSGILTLDNGAVLEVGVLNPGTPPATHISMGSCKGADSTLNVRGGSKVYAGSIEVSYGGGYAFVNIGSETSGAGFVDLSGDLKVGLNRVVGASGYGRVAVCGGSRVNVAGVTAVGSAASTGAYTVLGGDGYVNIMQNAVLNTGSLEIGVGITGDGTSSCGDVTVSGTLNVVEPTKDILIGHGGGQGALRIEEGTANLNTADIYLGSTWNEGDGTRGEIIVTDDGSINHGGTIYVGDISPDCGMGSLLIEDGAIAKLHNVEVSAGSRVYVDGNLSVNETPWGKVNAPGIHLYHNAWIGGAPKGEKVTLVSIKENSNPTVDIHMLGEGLTLTNGTVFEACRDTHMKVTADSSLVFGEGVMHLTDGVLFIDGEAGDAGAITTTMGTGSVSIAGNAVLEDKLSELTLLEPNSRLGIIDASGFVNNGGTYTDYTLGGHKLTLIDNSAFEICFSETGVTVINDGYGQDEFIGFYLVKVSNFEPKTLTWNGEGGGRWNYLDANWQQEGVTCQYRNSSKVRFCDTGSGEVVLESALSPRSVEVDNGQGNDYVFSGSGSLTGNMTLTKDGAGTLTVNTANDYRGVTVLNAGTLVAGSATAFGSGALLFKGGVLDLGGYAISNALCAENADIIVRNGSLNGDFTVTGGSVDAEGLHVQTRNAEVQRAAEVSFRNAFTTSYSSGGAIFATDTLNLVNNGSVVFSGNKVVPSDPYSWPTCYGGALYTPGTLNLTGNGSVEFSGNSASLGGAIYVNDTLNLKDNGHVTFKENTGSAVYASNSDYDGSCTLNMTGNDSLEFVGNSSSSVGGAIFVSSSDAPNCTLNLSDNGRVSFIGNTAQSQYSSGSGGAIYADGTLDLSNNDSLEFIGNHSANGGAIYANGTMDLSNNGHVEFAGNFTASTASPYYASVLGGGAVRAFGSLRVAGNGHVEFSGNYERTDDESDSTYRMRSVCMSGDTLTLAAGEGQDIVFYDPLYAEGGNIYGHAPMTVSFNARYRDKDKVERAATGDIVFSGARAAENLAKLKPNYTAQELTDSLTTEVYAVTHLYGGRLRIEDGAIYKGNGIDVAAGSGAVLRLSGGTLDQTGYDAVLGSGTTLELQGVNTISATTLEMQSGSTLTVSLDARHESSAALTLCGNLVLGGILNLSLDYDLAAAADTPLRILDTFRTDVPTGWTEQNIRVSGALFYELQWQDGILYFNLSGGDIPALPVLDWAGGDMRWNTTSINWRSSGSPAAYAAGSKVRFCDTGSGEVVLEGALSPRSVEVDNGQGNDYVFGGSGSLTGNMTLTKDGAGTLTVNTANDYRGVTVLNAGTLVAGSATAFGSGALLFKGGVLDLGGFGISNALCAEIADIVVRNGSLNGDFTVTGGSVDAEGLHIQNRNAEVQGAAEVSFRNAFSTSSGGAISATDTLNLVNNGSVVFSGNTAAPSPSSYTTCYGGALYTPGTLNLTGNGSVEFSGNSASAGGAIYVDDALNLTGNGHVAFKENTGSAVYASNSDYDGSCTLNMTGNDSLEFIGNTSGAFGSAGGAIYVNDTLMNLSDNGRVAFIENSSFSIYYGSQPSGSGGAIYASSPSVSGCTLNMTGNDSLEFIGNYSTNGGAIYANASLDLSNNGHVEFCGNFTASTASPYYASGLAGGAVCAFGSLRVAGNGHVEFSGNYERTDDESDSTYRMRSVCMSGDALTLAAGEGQDIAFYDPLYAEGHNIYGYAPMTVSFNDRYRDKDNVERAATGDIVFSGARAAENLAKLKPNYTAQELTDSLTSEVYAVTHLYGGRLRIEDGAIYKGNGIDVASGSGAVLRLSDGTLDQMGCDVVLGSSTTLELQGVNSISAAALEMQSGSTLSVSLDARHESSAALTLSGNLVLDGILNLSLDYDLAAAADTPLRILDTFRTDVPAGWTEQNIRVSGASFNELQWQDGILYLIYDPEPLTITWSGAESKVWNSSTQNWTQDGVACTYRNGADVVFGDTGAGEVSLEGTLRPESVFVENAEGCDYVFTGSGCLAGTMQLTKNGEGKLTVDTDNNYTGGTVLNTGILVAGSNTAFGTGAIQINGGELNLGGFSIDNTIIAAEGTDLVIRNGELSCDLAVNGGNVDAEGLHIQIQCMRVEGAGEVAFHDATSFFNGGAIYGNEGGTVSLEGNGIVSFTGNTVTDDYGDGGAIYGESHNNIKLLNNGSLIFSENAVTGQYGDGGAICAFDSDITIQGNGSVLFASNYAVGETSDGGAVRVYRGGISVSDNDNVEFRGNRAGFGGAISSDNVIAMSNNLSVIFDGNTARCGGGGALRSPVSLSYNGSVIFRNNQAYDAGFYIFNATGGAIDATNNVVGIIGNASVEFSANYAFSASGSSSGGAIYALKLDIIDNEHVVFRGNYEKTGDAAYRLRSVYVEGLYMLSTSSSLNLASGKGQDITFYDTLYASEGTTVSFNDDYEDKDGITQNGAGDIVFSGKYAKQDLNALKSNYTQLELADSLTTEVYATTNLYGGRLRIEDGAIYKGNGIAVASGSGAVLRLSGGSLDQTGYDVVLGASSMLELLGANTITANTLDMQDGSALSFVLNDAIQSEAALLLNGEFRQGGELDIQLTGDALAHSERAKLIELSGGITPETWDASMVSVSGLELCHGYLNWDEGTLYLECVDSVEWDGSASMTWNTTDANWHANNIQGFRYLEGDIVSFKDTGSGVVTLEGALSPGSVLVENSLGHDYTFTGSGRLAGEMQLTKAGAGMLAIRTANSYTGGTVIQGGTVELGNLQALGLGGVELQEGTLNLAGLSVNNDVTVIGAAVLNGGSRYLGKLVLDGGALSGTALQLAQDAIVRSGSIANNLTGQGGMLKTGGGLVELSGLNSYSGTTTIEEGTLKISGMVTGNLSVNGGTLDTANGMTLAYGQRVTLNGGNVAGNLSTREGSFLVVQTGVTLDGDLTFNGGTVSFANAGPDAYLAITGALNIQSDTQMKLSGYDEAGTYYLASFGSMTGSLGDISLSSTFPAGGRQQAILTDAGNYLLLTVTGDAATLNWAGGSGTWAVGNGTKWTSTDVTDTKFYTNDTVVFSKGGTVTISGEVAPKEMNVSGTSATVFKGTGSIVGEATLTKDGTGALTLNASNAYTGGTIINDGTVNASGAESFGENGILLNGGMLDMKTYAVENGVTAYGGTISGSAYNGALSVLGAVTVSGTLDANSIDLKEGSLSGGSIKDAMIYAHSGSIGSDITGESELDVDGDVVFTGTADHTLGTYVNSGTFTLAGSMSSDIVLLGGTLKTEDLQLGEWQLLEFSGGNVQGNVTAGENALLNLYTDSTIDGNLKLNGALLEMNDATLKVTGKLMVEIGSLDAQGGIEAREVQLGADAIMEVRDFSGETAYTVRSVEGESSYAQGVTFTADAIIGSGDTPALIEHSVIKLEESVKVEMTNVVLSADSMLLDDPATVVANHLVLEGLNGCNVAEGTPQTIKSGSILKRLGEPSELIELDEDAQACRFALTNIENVHLEGNCLTIDLSGMYPTLKEYCELYDWIGISLGSGDRAATIDDSLVVELKIQPNQTEPGYVGWGGTFVTVPANGENVGPVVYFRMSAVPEPSSSTLSLLALAALAGCRRRK